MTEDSQELVPPSPTSEGEEEEEVQDSSPECEEDPESPAKN